MKELGELVVTFVVGMYGAILKGAVIVPLWGWFIVPTFGLNQISFGMAVGLSVFSNLFHIHKIDDEDLEKPFSWKLFKAFVIVTIVPVASLFSGWLIHLFV